MTITAQGLTITTAWDVMQAIATALRVTDATMAEDRVYTPRSWPLPDTILPVVLLQSPHEMKRSKGKNAPAYDVTATIRAIARVTFKAEVDDRAACRALAMLEDFKRQIEVAVINNFALYKIISEISTVESLSEIKSDGKQPYGELTMDFACVFYQGAECFAAPVFTVIESVALYGDVRNMADPTGTYTPPFPYTPTTEPRTVGPDGRVEIGAIVPTPQ